ncbi:Nudix hydrolase 11 OS=Arabidopsis thaliana GN=NUDT11 PE=1 SV=2 [Rhizoctonia solani AG-1 IB]|uniref:Nudix hydrolase 11 n=1 Tax=Thanatephorus cucumeris (strain AG1-IB / isolate 7/3/14) TaxID=1108050 RepID=A0A0B7FH79_THACB|nr:Nudix hydrolase 11 OS=Arabidopsis thaliana GN=NUDT11 PE=1 SV=2 [Rhizoctonia solani AG-1 IB]
MFDPSLVDSLSSNSEERVFIRRIAEHTPGLTAEDCTGFPANRRAAVLVLLFVRDGHVRVLLTTRSKSLRSHPGQVALPGGRCDPEDGSMVKTAIREAHEEVGLSYDHPHVHILTTLAPFLSQFRLLVTPIIGWATSSEFIQELKANESEVDEIWDHPLEAILSPELVNQPGILTRPLAEKNTEGWPYESDVYEPYDREWMRDTHYRMHRFRTAAVPIKGLTADILIHTAEIIYNRQPSFNTRADDQLDFDISLKYVIEDIEADVAKKAAEQKRLAPA